MPKTVALIFLFTAICCHTPSFATGHDMHAENNAKEFLARIIENNQTPGLQYIIADSEHIIFEYHGGLSDVEKKVSVNRNTTFNGYSITKTFTAAAVLKLAQQGKLDIDESVSKYVPDFPYQQSPTIKQTLQHTGGFPNPNPLTWIHLAQNHSTFDARKFVHNVVNENSKLKSSPGEKYSYSNIGYLVLGTVIENVSGMSFEDYVTKEILQPILSTNDKQISFTVDKPANHATGYIRRWYWLNGVIGWFIDRDEYLGSPVNGWVPFKPFYVNGAAYGGLIGNADGFVAYLQTMLRRQTPFNQQMIDLLWTTARTNDDKPTRTGLAWFHGSVDGHRYFAHAGGAGGYYCEIRIYPDIDRASVIMTNNTGISDQRYLDQIDLNFLKGSNFNANKRS